MRTSISGVVLGGLLMSISVAFGTSRPIAEQTPAAGVCSGTSEQTFDPGLGIETETQKSAIEVILSGCDGFGANPAPVRFKWEGEFPTASCDSLDSSTPGGYGEMKWQNGKKSVLEFTSLDASDQVAGMAVGVMTYTITAGYQKGGSFKVRALLLPTESQSSCSDEQRVTELTGPVLDVKFSPPQW